MDTIMAKEKLIACRLLKTENDIEVFEKTIEDIVVSGDIQAFKVLFYGFSDKTEEHEVMFGLIHAIEYFSKLFPSEKYLIEFANSLPIIFLEAKEWCEILHCRILNSSKFLDVYISIFDKMTTESREIIKNTFEHIRKDDPELFGEKIQSFFNRI